MARNNQQQKQMYKNVVWYLIVLAVCYLPDRLTMVLNLLGKLDLDAELCHTWAWKHIVIQLQYSILELVLIAPLKRLISNTLIMMNNILNPIIYFTSDTKKKMVLRRLRSIKLTLSQRLKNDCQFLTYFLITFFYIKL